MHKMHLFLVCFAFLAACGILVSWPGIEPTPPALEAWSLSCWTTREVPTCTCCHASSSPAFSVYLASGGAYQYSGLPDSRALGGQVFPTLHGDLAIKGIQMRCGSLAELTTRGNFGRFPRQHFRAGETRLGGLSHSRRHHAD